MTKFDSRGGSKTVTAPSGIAASASFTPAAAAYGAGDVISTAKEFVFTFADGKPIPAGSLIRVQSVVMRVDIAALQASEAAYELQCYGVTPPSALADNAAWTLASADLAAYLGAVAIPAPVDLGAALFIKSAVDLQFKLSAASLFASLRTVPGFTATAVARQVQLIGTLI